METIQISSGVRPVGNESPSLCFFFQNCGLCIYKSGFEGMDPDHLGIPYHNPNESRNRRRPFNSNNN